MKILQYSFQSSCQTPRAFLVSHSIVTHLSIVSLPQAALADTPRGAHGAREG